jgi:nucleotide-binding universal stress UspA family protein
MILCAGDDSEATEGVLDTARWLADKLQAGQVAIHVVGDRSDEADKLVVGSRGRGGLRSAVLGSVPRELAVRGRGRVRGSARTAA